MSIIQKILVPVDGSSYSEKALRYAIDLAKIHGASLVVVHVVFRPVMPEEFEATQPKPATAQLDGWSPGENVGARILSKAVKTVKSEGLNVQAKLTYGHPAKSIVEEAKNEKVDLIVIGSRGISDIETLHLGSTSDRVAHLAPCPVLIVK